MNDSNFPTIRQNIRIVIFSTKSEFIKKKTFKIKTIKYSDYLKKKGSITWICA